MVCLPSLIYAQGPGDPGCGPDIPPELCPIDGGLSALFAIGVGYGIKKYKEAKSPLASQDDTFSN